MASVFDDDSVACSLHAAQLGEAEVAALAHDLGAQLVAVHAQGVVCLTPTCAFVSVDAFT